MLGIAWANVGERQENEKHENIGSKIRVETWEKSSINKSCRIMSTECVWSILDYKYMFLTHTSVPLNTLPLENPGGIVRKKYHVRAVDRHGQRIRRRRSSKSVSWNSSKAVGILRKTKGKLREYHDSCLTNAEIFAKASELLIICDIEYFFSLLYREDEFSFGCGMRAFTTSWKLLGRRYWWFGKIAFGQSFRVQDFVSETRDSSRVKAQTHFSAFLKIGFSYA